MLLLLGSALAPQEEVVTSVGVSSSVITDIQNDMTESILSIGSSTVTESDIQDYMETIDSMAASGATVSDILTFVEDVLTTIASSASVTEQISGTPEYSMALYLACALERPDIVSAIERGLVSNLGQRSSLISSVSRLELTSFIRRPSLISAGGKSMGNPRVSEWTKAPQTAHAVPLDIAAWLEDDTIQSVTYTALDESSGADATATVLDSNKNTFSGSILLPWIKAGTAGKSYLVSCVVLTTTGEQEVFAIRVSVQAAS